MSLLQRVKKDWLDARKAKAPEKAQLLTLVIADSERIAKDDKKAPGREVSDEDVLAVLGRHIKSIKEYFVDPKIAANLSEDARILKELELDQLQSYLPKQLSETEIRANLQNLKEQDGDKLNMGKIMGFFRSHFAAGSYDQGLLSKLAQSFINK